MFPVPAHLPRTGGEHLASGSSGSSSRPLVQNGEKPEEADPVLDLFEPLLRQQDLRSETVRAVREKLEEATRSNRDVTHQLLKSNYPAISSHIRAGARITADFASVQARLSDLEAQIDPDSSETSFVPPVLALLQRHFTAVRAKSRSQTHIEALKELKRQVEGLDRLETAVYDARGADEDVISDVITSFGEETGGALRRSQVMRTLESRRELLRSMVVEQVSDGYKQAISIKEDSDGIVSLVVLLDIALSRPRNPRPAPGSSSSSSKPSAYTLSQIYSALDRLDALNGPLRLIQAQLLEQLIGPLLRGRATVQRDENDRSASLQLAPLTTERSPRDILTDLRSTCDFIARVAFPESTASSLSSERDRFLRELHDSTSRLLLDYLILPSLPSARAELPIWLETVQSAVHFDTSSEPSGARAVKAFYDDQAGSTWANARRRKLADEVRTLILSGWQSWEAVGIGRDKEISVVVEVEVEDEDGPMPVAQEPEPNTAGLASSEAEATSADAGDDDQEEEGWGFEEEAAPKSPTAGPSSPSRNGNGLEEAEDGWAFDDDLSAPAPAPAPIVPPKPTREAKKLGKKVAKSRQAEDDDDQDHEISRNNNGSQYPTPPAVPSPPPSSSSPPPPPQNESMDWEAWDDEKPSKREELKPKAKRKELREESRTIKETFLVSKACETLLEFTQDVLRDAQALSTDLPAPSFSLAPPILYTTANEVFDLYRALITSHFAAQLQNVPTLSMQVYNDSIHLSDRVRAISAEHEQWSSIDTQRRLKESGEACFERELERQRDSLVTTLDGIEWGRGVEALKRSHRVPHQVRGDLEDLSRMFQPVLPTTTYLAVMGYLVNVAITYVTDAILSQQDITEDESVQLTELLRMLHPLEELFVLEPGQPSSVVDHVHGWLKFCYLLELLSANLVDITYLFENGALVDFTPDELIGLLKALFADSEKREKAIERIERGS